mmetsp:Transcript_38205/g.92452  ORF Transcript_38205/g.92452 Transcript_38205/m.92452 type:complete len:150 (+) Transcript_38205:46-495(+)|eukprot:CAMPEP_0113625326 /NCGR_PEP_ID=MMETSP0017_2-20120614/13081_1 /TAXON_ID=2856 /ORGANISM="Cylindrotheca closterium" /LENGTH=149 /DNA_ID=CAMNT_0000535435 /DNA_START=70 /DNA_END=519 /DNA_ORIENTATION=+ /assembly_acc=CAM_ASM_000147
MVSIEVPDHYGWVILGAGIAPVVTNLLLSGFVMSARKQHNVGYPNLYAVPGFHKNADDFNRVQRGHQNYMELTDGYAIMTLIGGLKHPIACAIGTATYCVGCYLYLLGYKDDTLDVKTARYKKGGGIKFIGFFTSLISCAKLAYDLISA